MAYSKTNWQDYPSTNTPITANTLNHIEDGIEELYNITDDLSGKIKVADISFSIVPSTSRGSSGFGNTSIDVSSLNITRVLGISFHSSSNHAVFGTTTNLEASNITTINIYGYRIAGTYEGSVTSKIKILYE